MSAVQVQFDAWELECLPDDGARLSRLRFRGYDLLTRAPENFRPPRRNHGEYETRPVFGYDDCFPTVDPCPMPGREATSLRDHGELCWQRWAVEPAQHRLDCRVRCDVLPGLSFRRSLIFEAATITWEFEVDNSGSRAIPFLHVMHALMPLAHVVGLRLPGFSRVFDEICNEDREFETPPQCADFLLTRPWGTTEMLLLRNVEDESAEVAFANGLTLRIEFDRQLFPTLGIWWNNRGYPAEDGCRRCECALEPIPGTSSSLATSHGDGKGLTVPPAGHATWQAVWHVVSQPE